MVESGVVLVGAKRVIGDQKVNTVESNETENGMVAKFLND